MDHDLEKIPQTEISTRIENIKAGMAKTDLEAILLTYKPDIFYFSGTAQDCYLYISAHAEPILFVRRYMPRARFETGISHVVRIGSMRDMPKRIEDVHQHLPESLGLALDVVPVKDYQFIQTLFKGCNMTDVSRLIQECRQVKTSWEIEQLNRIALLSEKTFEHARQVLKPGLTEMEFCGMMAAFARKHGHPGKAAIRNYRADVFPFHLLSGINGGKPGAVDSPFSGTGVSCAFPYGPGTKKIKKNEPVLFDLGFVANGYHMDETRMLVAGKMPEKAMDACNASRDILFSLLPQMKPGVPMESIFNIAVAHAEKLGYEDEFLGLPDLKSRFIGHGVGIELAENPYLAPGRTRSLKENMVFAVEPKFIRKDEYGVGIESVVRVTAKGGEFITTTPHEVFTC